MDGFIYLNYGNFVFYIKEKDYLKIKCFLPYYIKISFFPLNNSLPIKDFIEPYVSKVLLLKRNEKIPLGSTWEDSMVGSECIPLLRKFGINYGLLLHENYCCIDIDHEENLVDSTFVELLKNTSHFIVKSPRGWHFYITNNNFRSGKLKINNVPFGDLISGQKKYVLGPGSVVNGITYFLYKHNPNIITPMNVYEVIGASLKRTKNPIKYIDLQEEGEVVSEEPLKKDKNWRVVHPLHGSSKGVPNSIVNKQGLYCFRCEALVPTAFIKSFLTVNIAGSWKGSCQEFLSSKSLSPEQYSYEEKTSTSPIFAHDSPQDALITILREERGIWGFFGRPGVGKTTALCDIDSLIKKPTYFVSFKKAILEETYMRRTNISSRHYGQHNETIQYYSFWTLQKFIKKCSPKDIVNSIIIIDEAHELFTEISYTGVLMEALFRGIKELATTNIVILATATPIGPLAQLCKGIHTIKDINNFSIKIPDPVVLIDKQSISNLLADLPDFLQLGGYIRVTSINEFIHFKNFLLNKGIPEECISIICSDSNSNIHSIKETFLKVGLNAKFVFFTKVLETGVSLPSKPYLIGIFNFFSFREQIQVFNRIRINEGINRLSYIYSNGYQKEYIHLAQLDKKERRLEILKNLEVIKNEKTTTLKNSISLLMDSLKNVRKTTEKVLKEHLNWVRSKNIKIIAPVPLFDRDISPKADKMEISSYVDDKSILSEVIEEVPLKLKKCRNQFLRGLFHIGDEELLREFIPLLVLTGVTFKEINKIADQRLLELQFLSKNKDFASRIYFKRYSRNRYINCFYFLKFVPLQLKAMFNFYLLPEKKQERILKILRLSTVIHTYSIQGNVFDLGVNKKNALFELILNSVNLKSALSISNKDFYFKDLLKIYEENKTLFEALIREFFQFSSNDTAQGIAIENRLKRVLPKVFELIWKVNKRRVQLGGRYNRWQPVVYRFSKINNEEIVKREGLSIFFIKKAMRIIHGYLQKRVCEEKNTIVELAINLSKLSFFDAIS